MNPIEYAHKTDWRRHESAQVVFKHGDKVYDLYQLNMKVHTVIEPDKSSLASPINDRIYVHETPFHSNGKQSYQDPEPSLLPATKEVYNALRVIFPNRHIEIPQE